MSMQGINQNFNALIRETPTKPAEIANTQAPTEVKEAQQTPKNEDAPKTQMTERRDQTAEPPKTQASMAEKHVHNVMHTNHVHQGRVHAMHGLKHGLQHVANVKKPVVSRSAREMMVADMLMQTAVSGDHRVVEGNEDTGHDDRGDGRGGKEQHLEIELYKPQKGEVKNENVQHDVKPENKDETENKQASEKESLPTQQNTETSKGQETIQNQQTSANKVQDQLKNNTQNNMQQTAKDAAQHHHEHNHSIHKKHADHMTTHGAHQINAHVKVNKQKTTNPRTDDSMYNPALDELEELEERAIRTSSGGSQSGDSDSGNNSSGSDKRSQDALLNRVKVKFSPSELPAVNNLAERLAPSNTSNENKMKVLEISHKLNISNDKAGADNLINICNSPKFNSFSEVTQSKIIDFFKNDKTESSSAKKLNMEDISGSKKTNLSGELTGVTLNTTSTISNSNSVVQVNTANIKVSSEFDASLTVVTQNKHSSKTKLINDKIFGSAIDLKLGKVTSEQFKTAANTVVNKLSGTFSKHINASTNLNVSDNNIKNVLEKSFSKLFENLGKLKTSADKPYNNIRIPITQNESDQLDSDNIYMKLNSVSQALSGFNNTDKADKYNEAQDSIQQTESNLDQFLKQRF